MRELVGQGKPFYSALDKAAGLLRRKVGTGSEFLKELMSIPGVKQAEIAERGLGELLNAPKMTHEQFMAALGTKPAPAIHEKVMANPNEEMVKKKAHEIASEKIMDRWNDDPSPSLTRKEAEQEAKEFADKNHDTWAYMERARDALAMASLQPAHEDYTLPGGENYREMLIKAPKGVNNQEKIMELEAKLRRIPMFNSTPEQQAQIATYYNQVRDLKAQEAASPKPFQGVPNHFSGEPNILASMRLKDRKGPNGEKLLHLEELQSDWHQQGREKGYKEPFSEEDNLRYKDLYDKHFGKGETYLNPEELKEFESLDKKRDVNLYGVPDAPFKKNWEEMALKRLIHHAAENGYHGIVVTPGQEQADRYPREDESEKIAQEKGMKSFYDTKVPNILNGIGKKYGVKTELEGQSIQRKDWVMKPDNQTSEQKVITNNLHYFPITEEMRQDVKKNGIPLYKSGGIVSTH